MIGSCVIFGGFPSKWGELALNMKQITAHLKIDNVKLGIKSFIDFFFFWSVTKQYKNVCLPQFATEW